MTKLLRLFLKFFHRKPKQLKTYSQFAAELTPEQLKAAEDMFNDAYNLDFAIEYPETKCTLSVYQDKK